MLCGNNQGQHDFIRIIQPWHALILHTSVGHSRRCISLYRIVRAWSELSSVGSRLATSWARVKASSCFPVRCRPIAFRTYTIRDDTGIKIHVQVWAVLYTRLLTYFYIFIASISCLVSVTHNKQTPRHTNVDACGFIFSPDPVLFFHDPLRCTERPILFRFRCRCVA